MALKSQSVSASEFVLSREPDSVEQITIISGQNLTAGTVLGRITVGAAISSPFAANTGTGAMGSITVSTGAMAGAYRYLASV